MMLPGTYWIGDLCYVLHDEWSEACELFFEGHSDNGCNEGEFVLKDGRSFACYSTAYGDGVYDDNRGFSYGVDSGSLGIIKLSDIDASNKQNNLSLGHVFTSPVAFETHSDGRVITFGPVNIDTDPEYGEEEE